MPFASCSFNRKIIMTFSKIAAVLLAAGTLAVAAPAFAAGGGTNALSGNSQGTGPSTGSSDSLGNNPDANMATNNCFHRTASGQETEIVCPGDPSMSDASKDTRATSTE
jgi:hypothetical protein